MRIKNISVYNQPCLMTDYTENVPYYRKDLKSGLYGLSFKFKKNHKLYSPRFPSDEYYISHKVLICRLHNFNTRIQSIMPQRAPLDFVVKYD